MTDIRLPMPDGHDPDGSPWWRLADGERVFVVDGRVYSDVVDAIGRLGSPFEVEFNALVYLAAARYAVDNTKHDTDPRPPRGPAE